MTSKKMGTSVKTNDPKDAVRRRFLQKSQTLQQQYKSQYCGPGDVMELNTIFDMIGLEEVKAAAPMCRSGINPNFFNEYFSGIEKPDLTNIAEC